MLKQYKITVTRTDMRQHDCQVLADGMTRCFSDGRIVYRETDEEQALVVINRQAETLRVNRKGTHQTLLSFVQHQTASLTLISPEGQLEIPLTLIAMDLEDLSFWVEYQIGDDFSGDHYRLDWQLKEVDYESN